MKSFHVRIFTAEKQDEATEVLGAFLQDCIVSSQSKAAEDRNHRRAT